jgi:hypothetical protein
MIHWMGPGSRCQVSRHTILGVGVPAVYLKLAFWQSWLILPFCRSGKVRISKLRVINGRT